MEDVLQLVKPKRLYEDRYAILTKNAMVLKLGATTVIAPYEFKANQACATIPIKDLYNDVWDNAKAVSHDMTVVVPDIKWDRKSVGATEAGIFSSISAAGEDLFWYGCFTISSLRMSLFACGLTYSVAYRPKAPLSFFGKKTPAVFKFYLDWNAYYYLFQMFKNVKGNKAEVLYYGYHDSKVWFTNEEKTFYISVDQSDPSLMMKKQTEEAVGEITKVPTEPKRTQMITKDFVDSQEDALVKHLFRPFGDVVQRVETDKVDFFSTDETYEGYMVWLNKKK